MLGQFISRAIVAFSVALTLSASLCYTHRHVSTPLFVSQTSRIFNALKPVLVVGGQRSVIIGQPLPFLRLYRALLGRGSDHIQICVLYSDHQA